MFKLIEHAKSKNPGIKVFACSVSIGPFKDAGAEAMVVKLLSEFDRISVRDERSFAVCNGLDLATKVKCFPDIALSYPKLSNVIHEDVQNNVPQVGISLRHGHVDDETISVFARVLSFLEELMPNFRLVILELCDFHRSRDRNERDKLLSMLNLEQRNNVRVVTYANDFHSFYNEMSSLDFVICMRLHAAIISYATKTKFCMLPYHTKCIDFGKSIMDEWSDLLVNADDDDFNLKRKLQTILNSSSDKFFYKHRSVVEHAEEQVAWLADRN